MLISSFLRNSLIVIFLLLVCIGTQSLRVHAQPAEPSRPLLTNVKQISAGDNYTCMLTTANGVKCWGSNFYGQLGNSGSDDHPYPGDNGLPYPVDVIGLSSGVKAISAGDTHACALTDAGGVKCWGSGVPDYSASYPLRTPIDVTGLSSGVKAIDAGEKSTCALMETGAVRCWGEVTKDKYAPMDVPGLGDVAEIAVGFHDACARTTVGGVKCWGSGEGFVSGFYYGTAIDMLGLTSGVLAIDAASDSFCAVTADNVQCWGDSRYGYLSVGVDEDWQPVPVEIAGVPGNVKAITVGIQNRCVITQEDEVLCWGNNEYGGLGNNTIYPLLFCDERCAPSVTYLPRIFPPTKVEGLNGSIQAIASHRFHTCALSSEGTVQCWGTNATGVMGIAPAAYMPYPIAVQELEEQVVSLELGGWQTCARLADDSYRCWGYNWYDQLGTGDLVTHWSPRLLTVITGSIKSLAASSYHDCAVTAEGAVQCWGDNFFGQLGNGTFEESLLTPVTATGLDSGVKQVVAGFSHSCALLENGSVQCWGTSGQYGYEVDSLVPVPIPGLESGVASITAGTYHTCALMTDGSVKCWEHDDVHDITGFRAPVAKLDAGGSFNCALLVTGGVQCWGFNIVGGLGIDNKDVIESPVPLDVLWLQSGVIDIAAGSGHACAVTATGAYCWGLNMSGRIGDGTVSYTNGWDIRYRPTKVVGLGNNVAAIFAGGTHTCAILTDRSVKCWGDNEWGQLGSNPGWSAMPVFDAQKHFLPFVEQQPGG